MHLHNSKPLFKNSGITPKSIVLHSLLMWVSPILGCKEPAAKLVPHKKFTCSRREKGWDSWWTLLLVSRYSTDYGMFRFCVAHTELDWREGSEQYKFIENCLTSVDRQRQPWLIFLAHKSTRLFFCGRLCGRRIVCGTNGKGGPRKTLAEVQGWHCPLWPCAQLWKIMPGLRGMIMYNKAVP